MGQCCYRAAPDTLANGRSPLDTEHTRAIDLGAGTGSLMHTIAQRFPNVSFVATNISPAMLPELSELNLYYNLDGTHLGCRFSWNANNPSRTFSPDINFSAYVSAVI